MDNTDNNLDDVRVLSTAEAVRVMPGMYIGGTDQQALHMVIWNLIGFATNQALARSDAQISVTIEAENVIRVTDNGYGIPVTLDPWGRKRIVEHVLTSNWVTNHWFGRADIKQDREHDAYRVPLQVVHAVSERFEVEIKRDGYLWKITYSKGQRITELEQIEPVADSKETGTSITFQPDYTLFQPVEIDHRYMLRTLRELAFLMSDLTVSFADLRLPITDAPIQFHF